MSRRTYNYTQIYNHKSKTYIPVIGGEVEGLGVLLITSLTAILLSFFFIIVFSVLFGGSFQTVAFALILSFGLTFFIATQLNDVDSERGLTAIIRSKNFISNKREKSRFIKTHDGEEFILGKERRGKVICVRI